MAINLLTNKLNFPIYYPPTPTLHPIVTANAMTSASTSIGLSFNFNFGFEFGFERPNCFSGPHTQQPPFHNHH